jgi:hypothetical protein
VAKYTFDPHHPAFDEVWGFCMFIRYLLSKPETCFEKHAREYLRADRINHLEQKCSRSNYQSKEEAQIDDLKNATREWKADYQVAGSIAHARELLEWESKQTERLDARIARQIKFLFELKAGEEMLYKT